MDGSRRGGLPLLQVGLSSATLLGLTQLPGGVPKGYLRVLSFSEDSVLVDQRTVQLSTAALNNYETLSTGQLLVQQNGYVSVYVGNESAGDVYFDDVSIEHRQGLQVQENHYDPFGLDLAGVSGAAPGLRLKNFYQFNGKEKQSELGLNCMDFGARIYDIQIGRAFQADPHAYNYFSLSPYSWTNNNPIKYTDPTGMDFVIAKYKNLSSDDKAKYSKKEYNEMRREGKAAIKNGMHNSTTYKTMVSDLKSSKNTHTVTFNKEKDGSNERTDSKTGDSQIRVSLTQKAENLEENSQLDNVTSNSGHEIAHAWREENGLDPAHNELPKPNESLDNFFTAERTRSRVTEQGATHIENIVRSELGLTLRQYYNRDAAGGAFYDLSKQNFDYSIPHDLHSLFNVAPSTQANP